VPIVAIKKAPSGVSLESSKHRMHRVAARFEPGLRTAFLAMVETSRGSVSITEIVDFLERQDINGLLNAYNFENRMPRSAQGAGVEPGDPIFQDILRAAYFDGAQAEIAALRNVPVQKGVGIELSFDFLNPRSEALLTTATFELIREMSLETRRSLVAVVRLAFQEGGSPFAQARDIRSQIGLTQRQALAVSNFRKMLEQGDSQSLRTALNRALRDRRFDATILRAARDQIRIPQKRINRMVERYYERSLKARSEAIARTETLRYTNLGQQETWLQAEEQGLLSEAKTRRVMILAPQPCPQVCIPAAIMNADGVGLKDPFLTPLGPIMNMPFHTHCRCSQGLIFP